MDIRSKMDIVLGIYFLVINGVGYLLMGIDKNRARRRAWRIKESTLFLVALAGGSLGALFGMYQFRHKTKHLQFVVGIPYILALQVFLVRFFYFK